MFLCSLIEELCIKEENAKTGCNFNFGHECILTIERDALSFPTHNCMILLLPLWVKEKNLTLFPMINPIKCK